LIEVILKNLERIGDKKLMLKWRFIVQSHTNDEQALSMLNRYSNPNQMFYNNEENTNMNNNFNPNMNNNNNYNLNTSAGFMLNNNNFGNMNNNLGNQNQQNNN